MNKNKLLRIYICCGRLDKIKIKKTIKKKLRQPLFFVDKLMDADECLVIGHPDKKMEKEISFANVLGVEIKKIAVKDIPELSLDITNEKQMKREYGREYEL